MNDKIDGIFEFKSYRYVPYSLRSEWKTFYNYTGKKFYDKLNLQNKLFPYINIDIYNEELERINNLDNLCNNFEVKVKNLKPKNKTDISYSEDIKKSLFESINEIKQFLNVKKNILMKQVNTKNVPLKEKTIEHFKSQSCNNIEDIGDRRSIIIFSLIFIILFYLYI